MLNGNRTKDGNAFFAGANTVALSLTVLQSKLNDVETIYNDLADTNPATSTSQVQVNNIEAVANQISFIPKGASTEKMTL